MKILDRLQELLEDDGCFAFLKRTVFHNVLEQFRSLGVFHHQIQLLLGLKDFKQLNLDRIIELPHNRNLFNDRFHMQLVVLMVHHEFLVKDFDGKNLFIKVPSCSENLGKGALTDTVFQLVNVIEMVDHTRVLQFLEPQEHFVLVLAAKEVLILILGEFEVKFELGVIRQFEYFQVDGREEEDLG